jgi:hypothetical protein
MPKSSRLQELANGSGLDAASARRIVVPCSPKAVSEVSPEVRCIRSDGGNGAPYLRAMMELEASTSFKVSVVAAPPATFMVDPR